MHTTTFFLKRKADILLLLFSSNTSLIFALARKDSSLIIKSLNTLIKSCIRGSVNIANSIYVYRIKGTSSKRIQLIRIPEDFKKKETLLQLHLLVLGMFAQFSVEQTVHSYKQSRTNFLALFPSNI